MSLLRRFFPALFRFEFYLALLAMYVLCTLIGDFIRWDEPWTQYDLLAPAAGSLLFIAWGIRRLLGEGSYFLPAKQTLVLLLYCAALNILGNNGLYEAPGQWYIALLATFSSLALTWGLLGSFALILWTPLLILEMVQMGMYHFYGSRINALVIAEALEASPAEVSIYAGWKNMTMGIGVAVLAILLSSCLTRSLQGMQRSRLILSGLSGLFGLGLMLQSMPPRSRSPIYLWPVNECLRLVESVREALRVNEATVQAVQMLPPPTRKYFRSLLPLRDKGIVLVIHIGESVRADRLGINGYARETTPWLSRAPGLVSYPKTVSSACDTSQAQICILTDGRRRIGDADAEMAPKAGSLLYLFDQLGFDIYTFLGNEVSEKLKYDRVVHLLGKPSKAIYHATKEPASGIDDMRKVLAGADKKQNLIFFINNEGSHAPFQHFDEQSRVFTPVHLSFENPAAHAEGINNAYDNTIVYLDNYIRRVAGLLKGRPFVYLYVSDHGEYLGHDGIWGRAFFGDKPDAYHATLGCVVPMFWLFSPEFVALNAHFARAEKHMLANTKKIVAHEHVFHTLLGLFGIQSPYYNSALDLTQETAAPYDGPCPEQIDSIGLPGEHADEQS